MNARTTLVGFLTVICCLQPSTARGQDLPSMPITLEAEATSPSDGATVYAGYYGVDIDVAPIRRMEAIDLFLWRSDGTMTRLTASNLAWDPVFEPSGDRLAFVDEDDLMVLSMDDLTRVRLANGGTRGDEPDEYGYVSYYGPEWSPDGTMIAAGATNGGTAWIEVFRADTSGEGFGTEIYRSEVEVYDFSWTEDNDLQLESELVRLGSEGH